MILDNFIKVAMADLKVVNLTGILKTTGLGSCVGVTLYDAKAKVAGMAHVMLPSSEIAKEGTLNIAKYADTAIPDLIEKMKSSWSRCYPARSKNGWRGTNVCLFQPK